MNAKLGTTIYKSLLKSRLEVSSRRVNNQLQTHPDYPSQVGITDKMDDLDTGKMSLLVDKQKLDEVPGPFCFIVPWTAE